MNDREASLSPRSSQPVERPGRWSRWHLTSRDAIIALTVAALTLTAQSWLDNRREDRADRRENLRFLREQAVTGNLDKMRLDGIDLADQNLAAMPLRGALMPRANLVGADLTYAVFTDVNLAFASMSKVDMRWATMDEVNLNQATLRDADLRRSVLKTVDLFKTDFTGANLEGASFVDADGSGKNLSLLHTDFSFADLRHVNLRNTSFTGVRFYGADLRHAWLSIQPNEVICYDFMTRWPQGFEPPPSAHPRECGRD